MDLLSVCRFAPALVVALALSACPKSPQEAAPPPATPPTPTSTPTPEAEPYDAVERATFNRLAAQLNLPLFWIADRNRNRAIDVDEIAALRFFPTLPAWVEGGALTASFAQAYKAIQQLAAAPSPVPEDTDPGDAVPEDKERRGLVRRELEQGRPTLIRTDFRDASDGDRALLGHMLAVAEKIDALYTAQRGLVELMAEVPRDDVASQSLFRRNWGPQCIAPKTADDEKCSAIPGAPKPRVSVYPPSLQDDEEFCAKLLKQPNADALFNPFVVVREQDGKYVDEPYSVAFRDGMSAVAKELRATAAAIADPKEAALKAYLLAAAQAFTDNRWEPADEAWAKMNAENSRWYVRVAPDEVYWEPCARKAGFHLTFARINPDSLKWQGKLMPVQQEMEQALATLIGAPYKARPVSFHLPDFIDIVINAGDDRDPVGGTLGQSLPNWGPVANEGRGRTVAMTNLYTDPDSMEVRRSQVASLLDAETAKRFSLDHERGLLSTILHEAAHNLGPAHEYKVRGKTDDQLFGGPLSTVMEELKAQTAALWYVDFLLKKGIIDDAFAKESYVDNLTWGMGHISRGMYRSNKSPKPYSQLSAIQLGFLMDQGAVEWLPSAKAANGTDVGAFVIHFDKIAAAVDKLMLRVGQIKAQGRKQDADRLIKAYVDSEKVPQAVIAERILRFPKASFVYSVEM